MIARVFVMLLPFLSQNGGFSGMAGKTVGTIR
jgi:hypothetical protein